MRRIWPALVWPGLLLTDVAALVVSPESDAPTQTAPAGEPDADQPADDAIATPASQPADAEPEPYDILTTERLTGDWAGLRTQIEDNGIEFGLSMTNVYQQNVHGGEKTRHGARVTGHYDLELTLDLVKMGGLDGGFVYALANGCWDQGVSGRGLTGDAFGVNYNAVDDRTIDLTVLYYEQAFLDDHLLVRVGKVNFSFDFDTNAFANDSTTQFLNGALNNNPQIPFPGEAVGHLGVQFIATLADWLYVQAGAGDAQADWRETGLNTAFHDEDDFMGMFEFGLTPTWETRWGSLPGSYRFGLWYDPQPKPQFFNDLGGRRRTVPHRRDDVGFYVSFDQLVWREHPAEPGDDQGIGLFFRYGYAKADVNQFTDFWSVGGQYLGLVPGRDADVLGFGVAQGITSEWVRRQKDDPGRETVLELYYNAMLTPWLTLSPDVQVILDPGGVNAGRDALVLGVRLQASF